MSRTAEDVAEERSVGPSAAALVSDSRNPASEIATAWECNAHAAHERNLCVQTVVQQ
jgi:hypothetical protein